MIKTKDLQYQMWRIRAIEETIAEKYKEQKMRCPVHLSIGQEAPAVGVCAALSPQDKMVSTHRGHAHYLAKGGRLTGLIGELYGKSIGCSRGNGGSMHLIDLSKNFYGSTSIVAQTIPVGVGIAFADHIRGSDSYTVICFGDAAIEEGVFHESANFASLHNLNVLFVCENNQYSCFTHLDNRQPKRSFRNIARAHRLSYYNTGVGVENIFYKTSEARKTKGPAFIYIPTYRKLEHCGPNNDDHLNYRPKEDISYWGKLDEVDMGVIDGDSIIKIKHEIQMAFNEVEMTLPTDQEEFGKYIWS